jgi:hypothetical protein
MGLFKQVIERQPTPEFSILSLAVPLLCGKIPEEKIAQALQTCSHKQLTSWRTENCNSTHRKVRQAHLGNLTQNAVPKTPISNSA